MKSHQKITVYLPSIKNAFKLPQTQSFLHGQRKIITGLASSTHLMIIQHLLPIIFLRGSHRPTVSPRSFSGRALICSMDPDLLTISRVLLLNET